MVQWFGVVSLVGFTQTRKGKCALLSPVLFLTVFLLCLLYPVASIRHRKQETGFMLSPPETVNDGVALSPSRVCFMLYSSLFKQNITDLPNL